MGGWDGHHQRPLHGCLEGCRGGLGPARWGLGVLTLRAHAGWQSLPLRENVRKAHKFGWHVCEGLMARSGQFQSWFRAANFRNVEVQPQSAGVKGNSDMRYDLKYMVLLLFNRIKILFATRLLKGVHDYQTKLETDLQGQREAGSTYIHGKHLNRYKKSLFKSTGDREAPVDVPAQ